MKTKHGIAFQGQAAFLSNLSQAELEYKKNRHTRPNMQKPQCRSISFGHGRTILDQVSFPTVATFQDLGRHTLFFIFINDLSKSLRWSKHKLYADDVVLYTSDTENNEVVSLAHINEDIKNLQFWCNNNAITMNVKKTKYMLFGTRQ